MLVDGVLPVGLHAAEIAARVVRVDAGGGAEQERGGAFGLHAGETRGGAEGKRAQAGRGASVHRVQCVDAFLV